ncbi:MAG: hypothetical protein U9N31_04460 [Candidatus Marinimicrobia bacterium]|nr:hypothetical protein [Candidatus Neomarinimicrobiota bacterium]
MLQKLVGGLLLSGLLIGQTTANPQFSVIGDLVIDQLTQSPALSSSGVEIAIQGYVNPFARADVYLHKHNDESPVELEEAVITVERGLPFGLGVRAGKFRPDLGKINKTHAHLFPFIEAPIGMTKVLGEEFYAATGLEANWLMPLPWYSSLSVGYFDSGIGGQDHKNEKEKNGKDYDLYEMADDFLPEGLKDKYEGFDKVITIRQSNFFDINETNHIEFGFSLYGEHEKNFGGGDFKYKWKPNKYRSFALQGELIQFELGNEHEEKKVHPNEVLIAGYLMANYQFKKVWNMGVISEYWQFEMADGHGKNSAIFFGFSPVEESSILRLKIEQVDDGKDKYIRGVAQLIWSLGPHKPHRY